VRGLLQAESGQASIEYALLAVLISVAAIAFISGVGVNLAGMFEDVVNALP
jgi:Flp pilus assembly pilin Flp